MGGELAQRAGAAHDFGRYVGGAQSVGERARFGGAGDRRIAGPKAQALVEQLVEAAVGGDGEHLEAIRMRSDDVERRGTDRSGRAEDADALDGVGWVAIGKAHSDASARAIGKTGSSPSTRSRMPP